MTGLLLHLAGPLQSWGTRSSWNTRDTLTYPTRSAMIGLLAAAEGHPRDNPLTAYDELHFTIRVDRPGELTTDYHTAGGGRSREHTPPLAGGGTRAEGKGTIVSERDYLTDAAFSVAVTAASTNRIDALHSALRRPHYGTHLGRRSCPTAGPLLLAVVNDPVAELHERLPLARPRPRDETTVSITFITEHAPTDQLFARREEHRTSPRSFSFARQHHLHTTWLANRDLPADLCVGYGPDYINALHTYRAPHAHTAETT
jgi:CRISPR system Cascade subunit CasD